MQGIYDIDLFVSDFPNYVIDLEYAFTQDRKNWESPQHVGELAALNISLITFLPIFKHPFFDFNNKDISWLIVHSPEDRLVNSSQSTQFCAHLKELGYINVEYCTSIRNKPL